MIGIIGAMPEELIEIKKDLTDKQEIVKGIRTYTVGTISEKEVVLVLAGIGKVNAAITTSKLIEDFDVEYVINIGVAGGQNGVNPKDVVISSEVLHHDVDVTSFSTYVRGQVPNMEPTYPASELLISKTRSVLDDFHIPYKIGKVASGDQFVTTKRTISGVNELYTDIYAIEMEAAAIAQTATIYNKPFIVYRSISDILDSETQSQDFNAFVVEASKNAALILRKLLAVL